MTSAREIKARGGLVPMKNQGGSQYLTEDGRFGIAKSVSYTMCENPHPMRGARGHRGDYCEGNADHAYFMWDVFAVDENDQWDLISDGEGFDTYKLARGWLTDHLAELEGAPADVS